MTLVGVTVTDPLVTVDGAPIASFDPGQVDSTTFTATYTVTQADLDAGKIVNTATVEGYYDDGSSSKIFVPVTDTDDAIVPALQNAAITIIKAADQSSFVNASDTLTYTFIIENTGNVTLENIMVVDPGATVIGGPIASLAPSAVDNTTFTASYTVTQADVDAGSFMNTAQVTGEYSDADDNPQTTSAMDSETVPATQNAAITVTKSTAAAPYSAVGETIAYTITLSNDGNVSIDTIVVNDPDATTGPTLVSGDTDLDGILDVGEIWLYDATHDVTQADLDAGSFTNTVTVTGEDPSDSPVGDDDDATVNAVQNPAVVITKIANETDFSAAGDVLTYAFTVENTGNVTLSDVMVTDPSATVNGGPISLAPGVVDSTTFTASYTVTQADMDAGRFTNLATVSCLCPQGNPVTDDDTVTVDGIYDPSILLTKTADQASYSSVGETLTYTLAVENTGNVTLYDVTVTDPQASVTGSTIASLAPGQVDNTTFTASYAVTQTDLDAGSFTNTAQVDGTYYDAGNPLPVSDTDDATVSAIQTADITIVKTAGQMNYDAVTDVLTYTFTIENTGNVTLTNVMVIDPQAMVSGGPIPSLAPGVVDNTTFTASYTVTQAELDAGLFTNTAQVTATPPSGPDVMETGEETVPAIQTPGITVEKVAGQSDYDAAGDVLTYAFTVENTGNVTLTNVTVTDPQATVSGGPITLAPGDVDSATFTASYTVTQADVDAGSFMNTAQISGEYTDGAGTPQSTSNSDDETVTAVQSPAIAITKTANESSYSSAGDTLTYAFTIENTGNVTLTNVMITDPLATVSGGPILSLAPGEVDSTTFTASYLVTQDDMDDGQVVNLATVTATPPSGPDVEETGSETVTADQNPAIVVTKTANEADFSDVGDVLTYTFTVENTGNVTLTNIMVSDPQAAVSGGPIASLAPGAVDNTTFTASYTVTQADVDAGSFANTALVTATPPIGSDVSDTDTETVLVANMPAIEITKTANETDFTSVGDVLTYTFTVENTGNVELTNVMVSDPQATVSGGPISLAPGAVDSTTFTASHTVTQADMDSGSYVNTASVSGEDSGGGIVTDEDTATVTGTQTASIEIQKTAPIQTYSAAGQTISYTIVVENLGNVSLSNVVITDPLTGLNETIPTLLPGIPATYVTDYMITQNDMNQGSVYNAAQVVSEDPNGDPVSDDDDETVTAEQNPGVSITKTAEQSSYNVPGDVITYRFTISNTGNLTLYNITVADPAAIVTGGPLASLEPGLTDSTTFSASYTVTQANIDAGVFANTAMVSCEDPNGTNITDEDTEEVYGPTPAPSLALVKAADPMTYNAVDITVGYTYMVSNNGNVTLYGPFTVNDDRIAMVDCSSAPVSLAPGEGFSCTGSYVITQAELDAGNVTNIAYASGVDGGSNEVLSNTDEVTVNAIQNPAISVVKTVVEPMYSGVGDVLHYTFEVTNTGNVTLHDVALSDPDAVVVGGPIATMAPGDADSTTFTASYTVTQADVDAGSFTNVAMASGIAPNGTTIVQDSDSAALAGPVAGPSLILEKTADSTTCNTAGQTITYSYRVTNNGNVTLFAPFAVSDDRIDMVDCSTAPASLAPDETFTCTGVYTVTQADMDAGSVTNIATVSGVDINDEPVVSDPESETVTATQTPAIAVEKVADRASYAVAGEVITFTISVENTGNVTLTNIAVTDSLTGLDTVIAELAPGNTQRYTETYTVTQADVDGGDVVNLAAASGEDPNSNEVADDDEITVPAVDAPALTITKTASPDSYSAVGDVITYTITVENTGNVTITGIVVNDPLTSLNTEMFNLAPGETQPFTTSYTVTQADIDAGSVSNAVTASGAAPDDDTVTDDDEVVVTATQNPALALTKTTSSTTFSAVGDIITYTITVENTGNVTITNIVVNDPLTSFNTAMFNLAPGEIQPFTTSYTVTQADMDAGNVLNSASASGIDPNGDAVTTDDEADVLAEQNPAIVVTKTALPTTYTEVGEEITYTIVVENTGNVTLTNVAVTDPLTGLNAVIDSLEPGASQDYTETYAIVAADIEAGSVLNTATAVSALPNGETVTGSDGADAEYVAPEPSCEGEEALTEYLDEHFDEIDANDDGLLSQEEIQAMLPCFTQQMLVQFDFDNDGLVSQPELVSQAPSGCRAGPWSWIPVLLGLIASLIAYLFGIDVRPGKG